MRSRGFFRVNQTMPESTQLRKEQVERVLGQVTWPEVIEEGLQRFERKAERAARKALEVSQ